MPSDQLHSSENERDPLIPIIELKLKIEELNKILKEIDEGYNDCLDMYHASSKKTKDDFEEQGRKDSSEIEKGMEEFKSRIKAAEEALKILLKRMETENEN